MANLNLNTIALVSTLRPVPLNGAPVSEDYNDSQQEFLLDLVALSAFINNVLNPMLQALPDNAISGLEGSSIYGDSTDQTALFYDSLTETPLVLADSLRQLNAIVSANNLNVTNLGIQVGQLQQKLSSTNQNNIAITLQNLTNSLNTITNQQTSQDAAITALQQVNTSNVQITGGTISNVVITGTGLPTGAAQLPCQVFATSLTAQAAAIALTTAYTPTVTGTYEIRISLWTQTTGSAGTVQALLKNNNGTNTIQTSLPGSLDLTTNSTSAGQTTNAYTFHAISGQPIQYGTQFPVAPTGSPTYGMDIFILRLS